MRHFVIFLTACTVHHAAPVQREPSQVEKDREAWVNRPKDPPQPEVWKVIPPASAQPPDPECEARREEARRLEADELPAAHQESEQWFAKHCKRQVPMTTRVYADGSRETVPSAAGVMWACDNGQITDSPTLSREREIQDRIRSAAVWRLDHRCPR